MKKNSFSIGTKIFGGFIALIFIFSLNAVISILTINSTNQAIEETAQVSNPSAKALEDLMDLIVNSKMLITNWVYLPNNQQDKDALKELHNFQYPALKNQISALTVHWKSEEEKQQLDSIFISFEQLIGTQKEIMASLVSFQDYEDPMVKLFAENRVEDEVLPHVRSLETQLSAISDVKRQEAEAAQTSIIVSSVNLRRLNIMLGLITVALGLIIAFYLNRNITRPISYVKNTVVELSKGQLPEKDSQKTQKFSRDEVGEMAQAVNGLVSGLRATSGFAEDIGVGKYNAEFNPLSEQDVLGNALLNMRDNLRRVSEEDQKRHWATEGTALFGELLRQNSGSVKELTTVVLTKLIEHMHANQGGIFVVQEDNAGDEPYMALEACYAWDREKYIEQKIYRGEGLAGQAWLEKDTLYFTDVPQEYITIVSGLGEANPTSILIVPLMVNEEVFGVVEMASFETYQPHEIEFMKKIAESIAATIATARINSKTQRLLDESTEMTEQMQAQEEEMRQNMEELQATQEETDRKQRAMQKREVRIRAVLDCTPDAYITVNAEGEVNLSNRQAAAIFGYNPEALEGLHASKLFHNVNAIDMLDFLRERTNQSFVQEFQSQQGREFSAEVTISAYDAHGSVGYVVRFADAEKSKAPLQSETH